MPHTPRRKPRRLSRHGSDPAWGDLSQTWLDFFLNPFYFIAYFNQSVIALQSCVSVCGTAKGIRYTHTPLPPELFLLAPGPTPRPSQGTEPSSLRRAAASTSRLLYTQPCVCQSYSLNSSPTPLPRCVHKSVLYVRVSIPALQTGSSVSFSRFHIRAFVYGVCLSWFLFEGVARSVPQPRLLLSDTLSGWTQVSTATGGMGRGDETSDRQPRSQASETLSSCQDADRAGLPPVLAPVPNRVPGLGAAPGQRRGREGGAEPQAAGADSRPPPGLGR